MIRQSLGVRTNDASQSAQRKKIGPRRDACLGPGGSVRRAERSLGEDFLTIHTTKESRNCRFSDNMEAQKALTARRTGISLKMARYPLAGTAARLRRGSAIRSRGGYYSSQPTTRRFCRTLIREY